MTRTGFRAFSAAAGTALLVFASTLPSAAISPRPEPASLDELVIADPGAVLSTVTKDVSELPERDALRQDWDAFETGQGGRWSVRIDTRTALPTYVLGKIVWVPGAGNDLDDGEPVTLERLEQLARTLIERHPTTMGKWRGQLVLDREASFYRENKPSQITFRQEVDGIRVDRARFDFHIHKGNLVAFGVSRMAPATISGEPTIDREEARALLEEYMQLPSDSPVHAHDEGRLAIMAMDPNGRGSEAWGGARGQGLVHRLYWHFTYHDPNAAPTWIGKVDAHTGEILAFYDGTHYESVRGGVYPISGDGNCENDGCEVPGYPMPFVDYSEDGSADVYANDFGLYECATTGSDISTNLDGQYYYIDDVCGVPSESTTCQEELDLGMTDGDHVNCAVAPGASPGNTEAARSMYYSINRVGQKARYYLPDNEWLNGRVRARANVNGTCNAFWNGSVNMYRAGSGCGNTSIINGVVTHEWGHGFDQNDGGGYDSTSEAYADVVAIFESRESCVGRGFYIDGRTCSGYGDNCLSCTGIRDHDWAAREANTPATPANFTEPRCGGGSGPCGKSVHCESYVISESIFDLATRDLPAAGFDEASAWQHAEYLWFASREGSGGDIINCSLPNADSCGTGTWYHQMRLQDDDDGDLTNGTPNGAAIFAAFDRHEIACGTASDPENQSSGSCPTLAKPVVTAKPLTNAVELSWDEVPGAGSYVIHRADIGCDRGHTPLDRIEATIYSDDGVINDFTVNYRVQAFGTNPQCAGPVSDCVTTAAQPFAGKVRFDQATYGCSNTVTLQVTDANVGASTVTVDLHSDSEPTPEVLTLTETEPGSGKFRTTIDTTSDAPINGDGFLTIADGDTLTAEYVDADDGAGGTNELRVDTAQGDCVFPIISNVDESDITGSSATITWNTDEISDTVLFWGEVPPPTIEERGADRTTEHSITLDGLEECTIYYYEVRSTDPAGNVAIDDNGGSYYYFETFGDFGDGLQPCRAGQVNFDGGTYSCDDTATFRMTDLDVNVDPEAVDTTTLLVSSTTETVAEVVLVTETDVNSSRFTGSIPTAFGAPVAGDGILQLSNGDVITVTYEDQDDGTGASSIDFDTAAADCGGPGVSDLRVDTITDQRATVRWTTDEPGDTVVEWGPTPALGETTTVTSSTTGHAVTLNQFSDCDEVYFRISSTDVYGNTTSLDENGAPFRFALGQIPGLYYRETFEDGAPTWTLNGEWEVGEPQNLGGDPDAAYNNDGVLGHDLSGLGSESGRYEPSIAESAFSPTMDATTWTNTELIFYRNLRVDDKDDASIWVSAGPGYPLFRSEGQDIRESSFSFQEADVSGLVDGKPVVRFEFRQNSDATIHEGGWTVDDFILKDSTLPDYGQCSDCGTRPSFAGATSAVDNDACGVSGVTVSWDRAVSWGSGTSGTFSIHRSTDPGFTPSSGNRIASGVDAFSYDDQTAPTDVQLYYVVQAESDETCGTGPNNGGQLDGNTVRVAVSETSSRPTPGAVPNVQVSLVGLAHVRLAWDPATDATSYTIYRSDEPLRETFVEIGTSDELFYEDLDQGSSKQSYFYLVTGKNPCGEEGP